MSVTEIVVATTTFADKTQAAEMAKRVISARAAACAQIDGPFESHYGWQGKICQETEWRLTMKTADSSLDRLASIVLATHPYDLPQWFVVQAFQTSDPYRDWVIASVTPGSEFTASQFTGSEATAEESGG